MRRLVFVVQLGLGLLAGCSGCGGGGAPEVATPEASPESAGSASGESASGESASGESASGESASGESSSGATAVTLSSPGSVESMTVETGSALALDPGLEVVRVWAGPRSSFLLVIDEDGRAAVLEVASEPLRVASRHRLTGEPSVEAVDMNPERSAIVYSPGNGSAVRVVALGAPAFRLPTVASPEEVSSLRVLPGDALLIGRDESLSRLDRSGEQPVFASPCEPWLSDDGAWAVCAGERLRAQRLDGEGARTRADAEVRGFVPGTHTLALADGTVWDLDDGAERQLPAAERPTEWVELGGAIRLEARRPEPTLGPGEYFELLAGNPGALYRARLEGGLALAVYFDDDDERQRVAWARPHTAPAIRLFRASGPVRDVRLLQRPGGAEVLVALEHTAALERTPLDGSAGARWQQACATSAGGGELACGISQLELSADGSRALVHVVNDALVWLDVEELRELGRWPVLALHGRSMHVRGDRVVYAEPGGDVVARDLTSGEEVRRWPTVAPDVEPWLSTLALDGDALTLGFDDGSLRRIEEGTPDRSFRGQGAGAVGRIEPLAEGCRLAVTFEEWAGVFECDGTLARPGSPRGSTVLRVVGGRLFESGDPVDAGSLRPSQAISRLWVTDVRDGDGQALLAAGRLEAFGAPAFFVWTAPPL